MYILFQYTTYPIWESCKRIAENEDYLPLMKQTIEKGHKFFINYMGEGTYYSKKMEGERWESYHPGDYIVEVKNE
jgi:hypothetical protein